MPEITNDEVLRLMIDGGENLCDDAMGKWMNPEYHKGLEDVVMERRTWWSAARRRIREFAREIREWQKSLEHEE